MDITVQSIRDGAQESTIVNATGATDESTTPAYDDPMPYQFHTGPQFLGAFPDHSHCYHDGNMTGLLDTGEKDRKVSLPMESHLDRVRLQLPDKSKLCRFTLPSLTIASADANKSIDLDRVGGISMMVPKSRQQEGHGDTLWKLNQAIKDLNRAKQVSNISPAVDVFGSTSALLHMIRVSSFQSVLKGRSLANVRRIG